MRAIRFCMLAVCTSVSIPVAIAGPFSALYAFGDSLSDIGNDYAATSHGLPGSPYYQGRFSNGPIWIDDLAASLGLTIAPSLLGGTDFAYGGAETGDTPVHSAIPLDLRGPAGQIAQFSLSHPAADPNALYTIWIGSNDLDDVLLSNPSPTQVQADIGAIVGNIDRSILDLAALGARSFLVVTVTDLGKTPAAISAGAAATAGASDLSSIFDSTLVNGNGPLPSLSSLAGGAGINLQVLDTYSLLDAIVANGSAFGFSNTTTACLPDAVNFAGGTPCSTSTAVQNQNLFWDQKHPTSAGHALVGQAALATVVPEPASFLMLIGGFAGVCILRRRLR